MLKFKFIQTGRTAGDETTPYAVSLNEECSVGEFIDCVLKRKEWGYIGIKSHGHIFGSPNCEYRRDEIVRTDFTEEYLTRKVATVSAAGGWTRMDYLLTLIKYMVQEVTNFARFYALFNKLPYDGDREEFKKSIVMQYTWNRTDSLREMTSKEYDACCGALEKLSGQDEWRQKLRDELRRKRSVCLNLMQKLGIDTSDWARINDFCRHPRIAAKPFARITTEELEQLAVKLRSIQRKGGLKPKKSSEPATRPEVGYMLVDFSSNKIGEA